MKKYTFILLLLTIFIKIISSFEPNVPVKFARAKFGVLGLISGTMYFKYIDFSKTKVIAQFHKGFTISSNASDYKIRLVNRPLCPSFIRQYDLTSGLNYKIFEPCGSTTKMVGVFDFEINELEDLFAQISMNHQVLDYAEIVMH
ncbi:hypothetical protein C2G38_2118945 [Gigaspora rosea]|uniref:Uncharacterized protein n=1 Tax=Gigaspora rosea TaxID=44941 RepID=A0A397U808_9GLOM|nr:hypothetical protein C2G38_2118945 [Gigaspora rosea]